MGRNASFNPTSDGQFFRNIGYTETGSPAKFYLGSDKTSALILSERLEALWELVKQATGTKVWTENAKALAHAIRKREDVLVNAPDGTTIRFPSFDDTLWLSVFDEGVRVESVEPMTPAERQARLDASRAQARQDYKASILFPDRPTLSGQGLHDALSLYISDISTRPRYRNEQGELSDWGKGKSNQARYLLGMMADIALAELNTAFINRVIEQIANRPLSRTRSSKGTKPISRQYASSLIKEWRSFLKFLNRSSLPWKKPQDYELDRIGIPTTEEERGRKGAIQVPTYKPAELSILWKYATPFERCLMTLGLNCAFGRAEIVSLRLEEVKLLQPHPHAEEIDMQTSEEDSWIMRSRRKSSIYGEWKLWPETVRALEWIKRERNDNPSAYFLLTGKGTPLQERQVANAWQRLNKRIKADLPQFRTLSFNKLRKTAINMVRRAGGRELGSMFASHGRAIDDPLLDLYSNKPYHLLHGTTDRLSQKITAILDGVHEPFPDVRKKGGENISKATIAMIHQLTRERKGVSEIARETGVSRETVRRWRERMSGCAGGIFS